VIGVLVVVGDLFVGLLDMLFMMIDSEGFGLCECEFFMGMVVNFVFEFML